MDKEQTDRVIDTPELLKPGYIRELESVRELNELEEQIALIIIPNKNETQQTSWECREAISDLVKPPKFNGSTFNGSLIHVQIEVMKEPFQRLIELSREGRPGTFLRGYLQTLKGLVAVPESGMRQYMGFILTADAKSGGRVVGQTRTELWYCPILRDGKRFTHDEERVSNANGGIRRIISRGEIIPINSAEIAKKIGEKAIVGTSQTSNKRKPTGKHRCDPQNNTQ